MLAKENEWMIKTEKKRQNKLNGEGMSLPR